MRNQIADSTTRGGHKGLLDDYADVVYRAWRATDGMCRYEVEETLIQVRYGYVLAQHMSQKLTLAGTLTPRMTLLLQLPSVVQLQQSTPALFPSLHRQSCIAYGDLPKTKGQ